MERRLAAILAADMVGYSRLMGTDEVGTLERLKACEAEVIEPAVAHFGGRIVKRMGDGYLVEFASVVSAVECATAWQLDAREPIIFRIGIHLGDVIVEADDIFGDGVNIASRVEGLADPGGLAISDDAYRQVRDRLDSQWRDGGEREVKNIARPVRVWHWAGASTEVKPAVPSDAAPPALPDKPSIAVLPFANMSADADQDYFADGMAEDIITALSRMNWLFVIARNSTFAYKGRNVDLRQVARELGVRYVLEGSVRKGGTRLRITGQLIDAVTGAHLWADRFDGELEDVFELQDRVTESVVGAIEPKLRHAEIERTKKKRPENLQAYDFYLRALPHLYAFHPEANAEALKFLDSAIALDADYAPALANMAWCYEQRIVHHWPDAQPDDPVQSLALARRAIAAGGDDADVLSLSGFLLVMMGRDHDGGLYAVRRALDINPNSATVCWTAGWVHVLCGEPETALPILERLLRLSPADLQVNFILNGIGMAHLLLERFEEAAAEGVRSAAHNSELDVTYWILAPVYGHLGWSDKAADAVAKLRELAPGASVAGYRQQLPFKQPAHLDIILSGFRKAGLPES